MPELRKQDDTGLGRKRRWSCLVEMELDRQKWDRWGRVHDAMVRSLFSSLSQGECDTLLREPMKRVGAEAAGTTERPLTPGEIGRRIMDFEAHWGIHGCILEETPGCFVREVATCPCPHFHPTSCRILAWCMEGYVEALNPDCAYVLDEPIPAGDATCCWSVQL